MKKVTTWILLADGTRARIAQNDGPQRGVTWAFDDDITGDNLPNREMVSDRPGRTFDRGGQGRHAMEPRSDPHEQAKKSFARELAAFLERHAARGSYDRLIIAAPPKSLGDLRNVLPASVRKSVSAELHKDLVHVPIKQLAGHLASVLDV